MRRAIRFWGPGFGKEANLDALQFSLLGACFGKEASLDAFGAALQF